MKTLTCLLTLCTTILTATFVEQAWATDYELPPRETLEKRYGSRLSGQQVAAMYRECSAAISTAYCTDLFSEEFVRTGGDAWVLRSQIRAAQRLDRPSVGRG
jgi:hypothetical protein